MNPILVSGDNWAAGHTDIGDPRYPGGKMVGGYGDNDDMWFREGPTTVHKTPEPSTLLLLGSGLVGLAGLGKKGVRK